MRFSLKKTEFFKGNGRKFKEQISASVDHNTLDDGLGDESKGTEIVTRTFSDCNGMPLSIHPAHVRVAKVSVGAPFHVRAITSNHRRTIYDFAHADGPFLPSEFMTQLDPEVGALFSEDDDDSMAGLSNDDERDHAAIFSDDERDDIACHTSMMFSRSSSPDESQTSIRTSIAGIRRYQAIHKVFEDMAAVSAAAASTSHTATATASTSRAFPTHRRTNAAGQLILPPGSVSVVDDDSD